MLSVILNSEMLLNKNRLMKFSKTKQYVYFIAFLNSVHHMKHRFKLNTPEEILAMKLSAGKLEHLHNSNLR